ncbi:MAG: hydroxyacid dehydrogenase [Clostridiales bacterium]|nr:hydroxyacid dehydrogenase [Clostridiales bacterium]
MKLLHIGKKGNVERYTVKSDFTENMEIIEADGHLPEDEIIKVGKDADYIIADAMSAVSEKLINSMPNLKLIHSEGVGYNFFDLKAAGERNIYVCNCKGINASAVAEQAVLLMLGMLRDIKNCDTAVREGRQITVKENYMKDGNLSELPDYTVGLVGFGDIAKCVASLMTAFGVKTYYYDIFRADSETEKKYNTEYLPLDELLGKCGIISLHVPVTPETKNMANDDFFNKMQNGSYIVNTARGELLDSEALVRALKSGKIAMAALDTVAGEPVQKDNVLLTQKPEIENRILFSPHIGGITSSSFKRGYARAWNNIEKVSKGEEPVNIVNRKYLRSDKK